MQHFYWVKHQTPQGAHLNDTQIDRLVIEARLSMLWRLRILTLLICVFMFVTPLWARPDIVEMFREQNTSMNIGLLWLGAALIGCALTALKSVHNLLELLLLRPKIKRILQQGFC
ncbi:hypothetical protein L9G15_00580 [Shewanella sp. A3A]|nr:hypothetical protein [Shewanella ferrihydritica]